MNEMLPINRRPTYNVSCVNIGLARIEKKPTIIDDTIIISKIAPTPSEWLKSISVIRFLQADIQPVNGLSITDTTARRK
jgi:hypothetical protein